jgi:DNA-binding MarR family transcriptional regulator
MPELLPQPWPVLPNASAVDSLFAQVSGLAKAARDYSFGLHRVDGVPAGVAAVLQLLLHEGPQTVPRIGRARSTSRQNTQVLVNRMVAEKWVELTENPAHKRSALVRLTEKGRQLAESAVEREVGLHRLVIPQVTADDLEKTTALLARLREVIAKLTPTQSGTVRPSADRESTPVPVTEPRSDTCELPVNLL